MLAYVAIRTLPRAWQLPVVLVAAALAYVTGSSRVFLQMHYATDVVAGFASGAAWLAISIASVEATRMLRARRRR
jgi:undecaprenyl-diphosphatase